MHAEPTLSSEGIPREEQAVVRRFTASAEDAGRRLDLYLSSRLPEVSRTRIQELIDEGRVRLGGRLARRAQRVMSGDVIDIEVLPRPPLRAAPEEIALDVLYEDEDVAVVNKPAGMVVHAGAGAAQRHAGERVAPLFRRAFHGRRRLASRDRPSPGPRHIGSDRRRAQRRRASHSGRAVPISRRKQNVYRPDSRQAERATRERSIVRFRAIRSAERA